MQFTRLKVTAPITWFEKKIEHEQGSNKTVTSSSCSRYYSQLLEKDIFLIF